MSLSLKASADGLSLDLLLGATLIATFSTSGVEAGTLIASDAEAQGFTNLKKLLTPEKLAKAFKGSNQLINPNGYQKLPGGLILQWGGTGLVSTGASVNISFPVTFPNGVFIVAPAGYNGGLGAAYLPNLSAVTSSGFTFQAINFSSYGAWIAIGN